MDAEGFSQDTIIAFTSDHGEYMGDHWMGDKDFYHEAAVKVPLIIADPRPQADGTRGHVSDALVEMIDLAPTFMTALNAPAKPHIIEGRDLTPILHGADGFRRAYVISEHDYSWSDMATALGQRQENAHTTMIFDGRWKYIRCEEFAPILFDLASDPDELVDLGQSPSDDHVAARARLEAALLRWATQHHTRITATAEVLNRQTKAADTGIPIGFWDADEYEHVTGKKFSDLQPVGRPPERRT
jgi:arylsulfatase A-like enzyme